MKFRPYEYKQRQLWHALRALMHEDGFTAEVLSSIIGIATSTFYRYVKGDYDECEVLPGHYLEQLREGLAREWQNYRLVTLSLPAGLQLVHADEPVANGLADEIEDAAVASGVLVMAKRSDDPDACEEAAAIHADVARRLTAEAAAMRQRKMRRAV